MLLSTYRKNKNKNNNPALFNTDDGVLIFLVLPTVGRGVLAKISGKQVDIINHVFEKIYIYYIIMYDG